MATYLPRFALRLLVPALALVALAALGEPLPAEPRNAELAVLEADAAVAVSLDAEAGALRARAEAAQKALHESAAQMRWFVTLPATGRRCISDSCSG